MFIELRYLHLNIYGYTYLFNIRTGILDYLRGDFPWPAQLWKHTESKLFKYTFIYRWDWCFILPTGPCGLASAYLNVFTAKYLQLPACSSYKMAPSSYASWFVSKPSQWIDISAINPSNWVTGPWYSGCLQGACQAAKDPAQHASENQKNYRYRIYTNKYRMGFITYITDNGDIMMICESECFKSPVDTRSTCCSKWQKLRWGSKVSWDKGWGNLVAKASW